MPSERLSSNPGQELKSLSASSFYQGLQTGSTKQREPHYAGRNLSEHIESSNRHVITQTAISRTGFIDPSRLRTLEEKEPRSNTSTTSRNAADTRALRRGFIPTTTTVWHQTLQPPQPLIPPAKTSPRSNISTTPKRREISQPLPSPTQTTPETASYQPHRAAPPTPPYERPFMSRLTSDNEISFLEWDDKNTSTLSKMKESLKIGQQNKYSLATFQDQVNHKLKHMPQEEGIARQSIKRKIPKSPPPASHALHHRPSQPSSPRMELDIAPANLRTRPELSVKHQELFDLGPDLINSPPATLRSTPFHKPFRQGTTVPKKSPPPTKPPAHSPPATVLRYHHRRPTYPFDTSSSSSSIGQAYASIAQLDPDQRQTTANSRSSSRNDYHRLTPEADELEGYPASEATPVSPTSMMSTTTSTTISSTATTTSASKSKRFKALMQTLRERASRRDLRG